MPMLSLPTRDLSSCRFEAASAFLDSRATPSTILFTVESLELDKSVPPRAPTIEEDLLQLPDLLVRPIYSTRSDHSGFSR